MFSLNSSVQWQLYLFWWPIQLQQHDFSKVSFVEIDELFIDQRLDNFLIRHLKGVPKSRIYNLLRKGEIRVNKSRAKPNRRLQAGDVLRIAPIRTSTDPTPGTLSKQLSNLLKKNILFEDDVLIAFNKPSGLAVHGGSGVSMGAIEAFRAERPQERFLELVHRLDRDTSGCLLLAKNRQVLISMQKAIQLNQVNKYYQALVSGHWPKGKATVNAPLRKNQLVSGERFVKVDADGKPSVTHFRTVTRYAAATLLDIELETGRTHQIRVHCQFSGHPIAGDEKYGHSTFNDELKSAGCSRLFLHAIGLKFKHPISNLVVDVRAPLPSELEQVLMRLEASA